MKKNYQPKIDIDRALVRIKFLKIEIKMSKWILYIPKDPEPRHSEST